MSKDLSEEQIELNQIGEVSKADSKVLAAYVVVYRSLGIKKMLALACMNELGRRRAEGAEFDYESYIETELSKMPQPKNINIIQVSQDIKKQVRGVNGSSITKINRS